MQDQIVGNYKIIEIIGKGGMGMVFKGIDLMLEREVVIKSLRPEYARQRNVMERFRKEVQTLAMLDHPNIVNVYAFFRQGDGFFMVTEFIYGETLDKLIEREKAIHWRRAVPLFCQALRGIGHAHSHGIIHRDIKPANMIITQSELLKVMDFGIARVMGTANLTRRGHLVGTVEYMSPEQIQDRDVDAYSDIYSLGIVLYEMLTGRTPFTGDSEFEILRAQIEEVPRPVRQLMPEVPQELEALIAHTLAKQPEQRLQTVDEFRERLERLLGGTGIEVQPALVVPPPPAETKAKSASLWSVLLAIVAIVVVGGLLLWQQTYLPPPQREEIETARQQQEAEAARQREAAEAAKREVEAARQREVEAARQQQEAKAARRREAEAAQQQLEAEAARQREEAAWREAEAARREAEAAWREAETARRREAEAARQQREAEAVRQREAEPATREATAAAKREAKAARQREAAAETARRRAAAEAARQREAAAAAKREADAARQRAAAEAARQREAEAARQREAAAEAARQRKLPEGSVVHVPLTF